MQNLTTKTVREIALEMPVTTRIFEEFKIDYCCGGRKMFMDACRNVGASPETVLQKIEDILKTSEATESDWLTAASLTDLAGYIEEKHHTFTKYELENLPPLMEKVARVHGEHQPELLELKELFRALCDDLSPHMQKEEAVLFPYIRQLERSTFIQTAFPMACFGTVQNPVRMMMLEHDQAGDILRKMREVSRDYALPEGACPSYTALYIRLETLERDLHQHIHLENNLLFPKAVELEQKALSPSTTE